MASDDSDDDPRIGAARALAYEHRAARRRSLAALDFQPIVRGSIFATNTLFEPRLLAALRADALALEALGLYSPSGLSEAARAQNQDFGAADRMVCRVTPSLGGDCDARRELKQHLDDLRRALGAALGRPLICAEQYISIHRRGATLKRHMDEKHDELKGARGWTTSHRRSVSWLLYLTDECEGGELRSYCRNVAADAGPVGAHDGNIQVGWLGEPAVPVFMDSWCGAEAMATEELTEVQEMLEAAKAMGHRVEAEAAPQPGGWRPLSALYRIGADGERIWLSTTFDVDSIAPSSTAATADDLRTQLPPELQSRFSSLEAVPHEGGPPARTVNVSPVAGTLALFDSVTVPHEVMAVTSGTRVAMAGWFHEPQRPHPDGFDASAAPKRKPLAGLPAVRGPEPFTQLLNAINRDGL